MKELNIIINQSQGEITTNFEEIEKSLKLQMSAYENFVVSEDEISIAKGDLAFLRKLSKSIDDRRKEIKKSYLKPYNDFEESCKKLTAIINEPIKTISEQLDLFEQDRMAKKRERVTALYNEAVGEYVKFLPIENNFNEKWLNKSYSDNDIHFDISEKVTRVKGDLDVIKGLNSEIYDTLIETYINSGNNLAMTIARNTQYLSDKNKVIEQVKEQPVPVVVKKVEEPAPKNEVHFIVSIEDAEEVENYLTFSNIKFIRE